MTRNALMEALLERGISTRPGTHAVHMLGYYREPFGLSPGAFPGAWDCDRYSMAIPLHRMTTHEFALVVEPLSAL